ncbi:MAG: DNA polymerase IV [bacterium]
MIRKIIHVDMDAFYASVEQRDNPELRGKPVAVGYGGPRGVVAAASYEARRFGVHSAMPSLTAIRLCPDLIFIKHRFDVYTSVSRQIREIFLRYTDLVEPLSLDEAYLDVTWNKIGLPSATLIAKKIKKEILETTHLTASAGVSYNKFLAKMASGVNKPDGLTVIVPEDAAAFLASLPIEKFYGVGPATAEKMHQLGIRNGTDLLKISEEELIRWFGKAGSYYYEAARGIDHREVTPTRERKSLGAERTFERDLITEEEMLQRLEPITREVVEDLEKRNLHGRTVTLKIKYVDFVQKTRSQSPGGVVDGFKALWSIVRKLLREPELPRKPVRLLGVTVSNFTRQETDEDLAQMTLDL